MFKSLFSLFLMFSTIGCATTSRADAPPTIDKARTVVLSGVIAGGNALRMTETLLKLSGDKSGKPIDIIISSPGGDVLTGFLFTNVMDSVRASGTKLRCYVPTIAASMAFQFLVHCDERFALERSFLLFHRVRVTLGGGFMSPGVPMTAPAARELAYDMELLDRRILAELNETLGMDKELVSYHFERETLHVAADLADITKGFIKVYKSIPGLIEAVLDPKVPHMPTGDLDTRTAGRIIYIYEGRKP